MNFKELREEINSALDYNPDLQSYKNQVSRVINRHYLQISSQFPWLFLQKRANLNLRADVVGSSTNTLAPCGASGGTRFLTFNGNDKASPTHEMEGNYLVVNDAKTMDEDDKGLGGYGSEFLITQIDYSDGRADTYSAIDAPDVLQPDVGADDRSGVVLNTEIDNTTSTFSDWTIEFRRYALPPDCVELLGIMDRGLALSTHAFDSGNGTTTTSKGTAPEVGQIVFIDALKEEIAYLDRDNSGNPVVAVESAAVYYTAPESAPILAIDDGGAFKPSRLSAGTYEYCYTFLYAGVESPPSPVASIKFDGGELDAIAVCGLEDTTCNSDDARTGRCKRLYRRRIVEDGDAPTPARSSGVGTWRHVGDLKENEAISLSAAGSAVFFDRIYPPGHTTGWPDYQRVQSGLWTYHNGSLFDLRVLDETGPRQYLRVYSRPSADMKVELRYQSRPRRLNHDNDYPEWPPQYHHVLVYKSLADICLQHGMTGQSQLYDKRAEDLLNKMRQKYLARRNRRYIRSGFDRSVMQERWGVPTKV